MSAKVFSGFTKEVLEMANARTSWIWRVGPGLAQAALRAFDITIGPIVGLVGMLAGLTFAGLTIFGPTIVGSRNSELLAAAVVFFLGALITTSRAAHRSIEHWYRETADMIRAQKDVEFLPDHKSLFRVGTEVAMNGSRLWATDFRFVPSAAREEGNEYETIRQNYIRSIAKHMKQNPNVSFYRAISAVSEQDRKAVREQSQKLLEAAPGRVQIRDYDVNPLCLNCLISEDAAILSFPERPGDAAQRVGVRIGDPKTVAALQRWYDAYVWWSDCPRREIKTVPDTERIGRLDSPSATGPTAPAAR